MSEYSALRVGIFEAWGSIDPMWSWKSGEEKPLRPVHRLDEPTGLSLSMVASPQCRFRFARQNHCSAAATSAANFRMRLITVPIRLERPRSFPNRPESSHSKRQPFNRVDAPEALIACSVTITRLLIVFWFRFPSRPAAKSAIASERSSRETRCFLLTERNQRRSCA